MTFEAAAVAEPVISPLTEGWMLESVAGPVPAAIAGRRVEATVPGSVHTDLLAAGLIADPYLDDQERLLAWIGQADWRYATRFDWRPGGHTRSELVFEGLDTVARVELNGTLLGTTANMHRTYRFDVRGLLLEGENELVVSFSSPVKHADRMSLELGYRPHVNHHPYNAIRKMACSFGWDWGPDTATMGIWRPVALHEWSGGRLASVRPTAEVAGDAGLLTVRADVERDDADRLLLRATAGGVTVEVPVTDATTTAVLEVAAVRRWWPRGFGEQERYEVVVELVAGDSVVDSWRGQVGFRSIELDTGTDDSGTRMTFVVNGQPIFVRGANWIPDDAFPHRVTRDRYARRIEQAESANINLLRVWGGGIFESDDFYELCDERGLLVWQDFLFACAAYAEEEPMWSEVEAEARDNVARIMPHPSLAIWNGSNENLEGYHDWGWQARLEGRSWGSGYYDELLPAIVAELDPGRPYTPSSPWSPGGQGPNDPAHGSIHIWDMWNRQDYEGYRQKTPRFVAEFGWQGPPTWSTLVASVSDEPLTPESPGMLVHQKAAGGNDKLTDGLVPHLPFPNDMTDWHWAMSLNQATAVGVGIEHLRSLSPHCAGSIVWQLNDCWPVTSWAAVDGYGRAKPLLYAIRHAYADRLVTVQPRGEGLAAIIVNDSPEALEGTLELSRIGFDGAVLASAGIPVSVAARATVTVPIPAGIVESRHAAAEAIVAAVGGARGLWFFEQYKDSALPPAELEASAVRTASGYEVTVVARSLVRDLALLADKLDPDAEVDDMLVTLLPGERAVFAVTSARELDPAELLDPAVLRSANQLLHPAEAMSAGLSVGGMTWGWTGIRGSWANETATASIDALAALGGNWVAVTFAALQETAQSTVIPFEDEPTVTDDEVRWAIRAGHERGLKVCLKPVVNCADGTWRAHIGFFDRDVPGEPSWAQWFASYERFMLHYARIAEEEGCELLCIGCEMVRADSREAEWRALIARVREAYSGAITYNCDKYQEDRLSWWDAVDVVSSSGYYPSGSWQAQLDRIGAAVVPLGKPFLFMEAGCPSRAGSAARPNDWSLPGAPSGTEQESYYREMFAACAGRPWLRGFMLWDWPAALYPAAEARLNDDYCVHAKPAEELVRVEFRSRSAA